jgi:hypothetical protein
VELQQQPYHTIQYNNHPLNELNNSYPKIKIKIKTANMNKELKSCLWAMSLRLTDPDKGPSRNIVPKISTFREWNNFLNEMRGWLVMEIENKDAEILYQIPLGEVIPDTRPTSIESPETLYLTYVLRKFLMVSEENKLRVILNYESFGALLKDIRKQLEMKQLSKFDQECRILYNKISRDSFWTHFLISEKVSDYLKQKKIGEVIPYENFEVFSKEKKYVDRKINWDDNEECSPLDQTDKTHMKKNQVLLPLENIKLSNTDILSNKMFYRYALSSQSIWFIILKTLSCVTKTCENHVNIHEFLKKNEFVQMFSKLEL